jgi:hypothetical protein
MKSMVFDPSLDLLLLQAINETIHALTASGDIFAVWAESPISYNIEQSVTITESVYSITRGRHINAVWAIARPGASNLEQPLAIV